MLKKFRLAHPYLFAVAIYLVFFVTMNATAWVSYRVADLLAGGKAPDSVDPVIDIICEVVPAVIFCVILSKIGKLDLLKRRGRGFWAGLVVGAPCLAYIAYITISSFIVGQTEYGTTNFAATSVAYVVSMLMVGLTEEIEARALIGETFLEHFGTKRAGAIKAAVLSGVIFGAMHMTNVITGTLGDTVVQVILCITGGILYGAIYFRSGNLWSIALIHGLNDVGASIAVWLFQGGIAVEEAASSAITLGDLTYPFIVGVLDIAIALYLLRPQKIEQVAESWPEIAEDGDKAEIVEQAA